MTTTAPLHDTVSSLSKLRPIIPQPRQGVGARGTPPSSGPFSSQEPKMGSKRKARRKKAKLNKLRTGYFFGDHQSWITRKTLPQTDLLKALKYGAGPILHCVQFQFSQPEKYKLLWCQDASHTLKSFVGHLKGEWDKKQPKINWYSVFTHDAILRAAISETSRGSCNGSIHQQTIIYVNLLKDYLRKERAPQ